MGQKTNPISLRIASSTRCFDNSWYSDSFYTKLLSIDLSLYNYINTFFKFLKLPSTRLSIQHLPKKTKLYVFFCYPQKSRDSKSKNFQITTLIPAIKTKQILLNSSLQVKKQKKNTSQLLETKFQTSNIRTSLQHYCKTIVLLKQDNTALKKKVTPNYFSTLQRLLFQQNKFNTISSENRAINKINFTKNVSLKFKNKNQVNILKFLFLLNLSSDQFYKSFLNSFETKFYLNDLFSFLKRADFKKLFKFIYGNKIIKTQNFFLFFNYLLNSVKNSEKSIKSSVNLKYKNHIENSLSNYYKTNIELIPFKIVDEWQSANYFADEIVYLVERRVSFRRLKSLLAKEISQNPKIRGIRILCSGRVGGKSKKAQRAKVESFKYGQTSLHVFSSKIDFAIRIAFTPLGSTGIKVWICYN